MPRLCREVIDERLRELARVGEAAQPLEPELAHGHELDAARPATPQALESRARRARLKIAPNPARRGGTDGILCASGEAMQLGRKHLAARRLDAGREDRAGPVHTFIKTSKGQTSKGQTFSPRGTHT